MIDTSSTKGRLIAASTRLAAVRDWREVSLADIAAEAGLTLAELREAFPSKAAIVAGLMRAIDAEVLAKAPRPDGTQNARDRLFEVVMARFDALEPYKAALASITTGQAPDPKLAAAALSSQRWMLEAAGISSDGLDGAVRTAGLASVYATVFQIWLADDDPGLARTMAALDRRLRRGESAMSLVDGVCGAMRRLTGGMRRGSGPATPTETPAPAAGPPPT
ncbi:MAG: TetR family transcriptional regulator [Hyphomicrobiaceae bacterium]